MKVVKGENADGKAVDIVISRTTEAKVVDAKTGITLSTNNIPYGSQIFIKDGDTVAKGDILCNGIHITV